MCLRNCYCKRLSSELVSLLRQYMCVRNCFVKGRPQSWWISLYLTTWILGTALQKDIPPKKKTTHPVWSFVCLVKETSMVFVYPACLLHVLVSSVKTGRTALEGGNDFDVRDEAVTTLVQSCLPFPCLSVCSRFACLCVCLPLSIRPCPIRGRLRAGWLMRHAHRFCDFSARTGAE